MTTTTPIRITYGNLSRAGRQGLLGLPLWAFLAGMVGVVVAMIFFMLVEWWVGLLIGVLWLGALVPLAFPAVNGRTLYDGIGSRFLFARAKRKRTNVLLNGPTGTAVDGSFRLPGLAAQSEVREFSTGYGQQFALVSIPSTDHHTVVLRVHATGSQLVDQREIDGQVAQWGAWLTHLGVESGIVGASVTVETSTDSGLRLRKAVLSPVSDQASEFGRTVTQEIADTYGVAAPAITTHVAITFTGNAEGQKRTVPEVAGEIANVLPTLMDGLRSTGAGGHVVPATSADLTDYVRSAYDPQVATAIEEARAAGGTGLTWDQAGPAFHEAEFDHYRHDRAVSTSWTLGGVPKGTFYDTSLARLLAPEPKVLRKRVTLLYRPIGPGRTTVIADRKLQNAQFVAGNSKKNQAIATSVMTAARKTAEEEAAGAGMTLFGMVVTATVRSVDELRTARQVISTQSSQARLRMRPTYGSQDTAFVAGLPLGVVLPFHTTVPANISDQLT